MSRYLPRFPFKIGTTSMVFGDSIIQNIKALDGLVDHVEIVLFHTPSLHNIPGPAETRELKRVGEQSGVTFSVHLPASLEIASRDKTARDKSVHLATDWCLRMAELNPTSYVLHIPFHPPTLTPVPGLYFKSRHTQGWNDWTRRARESLAALQEVVSEPRRLLVENINYSPGFLVPFCEEGLCALCLDLGHLILGQENVLGLMRKHLGVTRETHLHGVTGYQEHLSLSVLPGEHVQQWVQLLTGFPFEEVLILEVFDPRDLKESLQVLVRSFQDIEGLPT